MKNTIRSLTIAVALFAANSIHAQTYYLESLGGVSSRIPYPMDPYAGAEPIETVDASRHIYLIEDVSGGGRFHAMDDSESLNPNDSGGGGGLNEFSDFTPQVIDTNGLWLQISNVFDGQAYLSLCHATDFVYEIFSRESLTDTNGWQIETELFPGIETNTLPFNLSLATHPSSLFLWARDWTGIISNGNTVPEWWLWLYYQTIDLSDSTLDSQGNTLLYDYQNGLDPNVIEFSLSVTNQYVNASVPMQLNVTAGEPFYIATLVDSADFSNATWNTYTSSNITVNLGSTQGWHDVWVGLRGFPTNATQTWQWEHLNLASAPLLVITNPAANVVDEPIIQIYGYCQESLSSISYDISNAAGVFTNQPSEIIDRDYDTNVFGFTKSYFECLDVQLTNGLNAIIVHATDLAGDVTTTNFNFTLDYSGKTNPPAIQIVWPQDGTQISSNNFTCRGWISDPTAVVSTSLVFSNGNTNVFPNGIYTNIYPAAVDRTGNFWLENLPVNAGTNVFAIAVTDVVGNTSVTNISVVKSALTLTINPVTPDSQLWQPTVNLTGTISDSTYAVWVNGVKGHNNGDGTWSANNVSVNDGGTANFTATAYSPTEQQPDGSYGN